MIRLLVTGSRTINNINFVSMILDVVIEKYRFDEIIVGDARGVDRRTMDWCCKQIPRMPFTIYKPEWSKYGKAAGPINNKEMVEACDIGIGIWDGKSRGTKHCIDELKKAGKLIEVFKYEQ